MKTGFLMAIAADACGCVVGRLAWTSACLRSYFITRLIISTVSGFIIAVLAVAIMFWIWIQFNGD